MGEHLRDLKALQLRCNRLTSVPDALGQCTALEALDMSRNLLSECTGAAALPRLRSLNVSSSAALTALPALLPSTLRELRCADCGLEAIAASAFTGSPHLEVLDLARNRLEELPLSVSCLAELRHLALDENRIETIPDRLCDCEALVTVSFDFNGDIRKLPPQMGHWRGLTTFRAARANIAVIPESFRRLTKLHTLDLGGSPIRVPVRSRLPHVLSIADDPEECDRVRRAVAGHYDALARCNQSNNFDVEAAWIRAGVRKAPTRTRDEVRKALAQRQREVDESGARQAGLVAQLVRFGRGEGITQLPG